MQDVVPHLEENFLRVVKDYTAGDPMRPDVKWTNLTLDQIAERLSEGAHQSVSPWSSSCSASTTTSNPQGPQVPLDGAACRPQPAVREYRPAQAGVHGDGQPDSEHRHEEEGVGGQLLSRGPSLHSGDDRDVRSRLPPPRA